MRYSNSFCTDVRLGCYVQVASVLWEAAERQQQESKHSQPVLALCLACMEDPVATEKLLESLLGSDAVSWLSEQAAVGHMERALLSDGAVLDALGIRSVGNLILTHSSLLILIYSIVTSPSNT